MQQITQHPDVTLMSDKIEETRAAIKGEFFVKALREKLLPHMSDIDKTSQEAKRRYDIYIAGAEYDNYPSKTLKSLIGRMKFDQTKIEVPDSVGYLVQSVDGDGLSAVGMMQNCASEILQVKWHVLVADYQGLSDVDISELSLADRRALNPRATVKQYTRENVINWHYSRINGVLQLTYIMLREIGSQFNPSTGERTAIESYLVLALDDDGNYYQQKIVKTTAGLSVGEMSFVSVGGAPLKWLPVIIVSDEELESGSLPAELGYLSPVCDLALHSYRMSAEYKETIRNLPPTTFIKGTSASDWQNFKDANGREYLQTGSGSVNILFGDMSVEIAGADTAVEPYERYFEKNTEKAKQQGAVMQGSDVATTATEAELKAAEQNAQLQALAQSIESAFKRAFLYCLMFEGAVSQDGIEQSMDLVAIEIPREFARAKMPVEESRLLADLSLSGFIPKDEVLNKFYEGGVIDNDAETTMAKLDLTM